MISKLIVSREVFWGRDWFAALICRAGIDPKREGESSEKSVHIYQAARRHIQHKYTLWIKRRILNDKAVGIREIAVCWVGGG
jgi:hypothetical protein